MNNAVFLKKIKHQHFVCLTKFEKMDLLEDRYPDFFPFTYLDVSVG